MEISKTRMYFRIFLGIVIGIMIGVLYNIYRTPVVYENEFMDKVMFISKAVSETNMTLKDKAKLLEDSLDYQGFRTERVFGFYLQGEEKIPYFWVNFRFMIDPKTGDVITSEDYNEHYFPSEILKGGSSVGLIIGD